MGKSKVNYLEMYKRKIGPANISNYSDPELVREEFYDYLNRCERAGMSPTFEGMMADIFKSKASYKWYRSKESLQEIFEYIDLVLADITINGGLSDNMKKMILQKNCEYSDKVETVNTNSHNHIFDLEEKEKKKKELQEKFGIEVIPD